MNDLLAAVFIATKYQTKRFLPLLVFCCINNWIDATVREHQNESEVIEIANEINIKTTVIYGMINLIPRPTEHKTSTDESKSFNDIFTSLVEAILFVVGEISTVPSIDMVTYKG